MTIRTRCLHSNHGLPTFRTNMTALLSTTTSATSLSPRLLPMPSPSSCHLWLAGRTCTVRPSAGAFRRAEAAAWRRGRHRDRSLCLASPLLRWWGQRGCLRARRTHSAQRRRLRSSWRPFALPVSRSGRYAKDVVLHLDQLTADVGRGLGQFGGWQQLNGDALPVLHEHWSAGRRLAAQPGN